MPSRQTLLDLIAKGAPARTQELLAPLVELLSVARDAFGGDLDKYLILTVITIRAANHPDFLGAIAAARSSGEPPPIFPSLGINIQSIADSVGAPKETVRRKVAEMVDAGWIERRGNQLHLTGLAYQIHQPVRELMHGLFARNYEAVREMLADEGINPD